MDTISRPWWFSYYMDVFAECATKGFISYRDGKTLNECAIDLIAEYDKPIKDKRVNPIYSNLLKNKQSQVTIINKEEKTIHD